MENWKSNLAAAWAAQFLCVVGWTAAAPFLPLYIRQLGVTELHQVEIWSGVLMAATSIAAAMTMPLWGALADQYGHKRNVERAALGIAITFIAMAFAENVQQLLILRILQGFVAGLSPALTALVCASVPMERIGFSLGIFQMSMYAGGAAGPLVGGLLADSIGYRWTFALAGALNLAAALAAIVLLKEKHERRDRTISRSGILAGARTVAHSPVIFGAILVMGGICMADTASKVILPLFVETLQVNPAQVNTATGIVLGTSAFAAAVSSVLAGRMSDRARRRWILLACAAGAALAYAGQAISPGLGVFIAAGIAAGAFGGGLIPTANGILARTVRKEEQGAVYGLSGSVNSAGNALGPMLGAAAATGWGMRSPFVVAAVLSVAIAAAIAVAIRPPAHRHAGTMRE